MNRSRSEKPNSLAGTRCLLPLDAADEGVAPVLDEVVRRVVEVADPDAIILFGSAARGSMGPDSDIDLLVIKTGANRRRLAQAIYRRLIGVGQAVDVVVLTPDDVRQYQHASGTIVEPALREGKAIYGTWSPAAG